MNKPTDLTPALSPHLLTVDEVMRLVGAGVLREKDRVELIDGVLYDMSPEGALHMRVVSRIMLVLAEALARRADLRARYSLSPNGSLKLNDRNLRIPDLMVVPLLDGETLPTGAGAALTVEVVVSSLDYDLGAKRRAYAAAGVKEAWVADPDGRVLHVFRDAAGDDYATAFEARAGERVSPLFAPDLSFAVGDLI
ncbi:MAG: Uma2 family endonuclease [Caulobacterales bacterium]|nr:Uma2 family endonuclease [Caulobacterales bacterium]